MSPLSVWIRAWRWRASSARASSSAPSGGVMVGVIASPYRCHGFQGAGRCAAAGRTPWPLGPLALSEGFTGSLNGVHNPAVKARALRGLDNLENARATHVAFRVPRQPHQCREVRERVAAFARGFRIADDDLAQLLTAVGEAIANAIEHSRADGPIEVRCDANSERIVAVVRTAASDLMPRRSSLARSIFPRSRRNMAAGCRSCAAAATSLA